MQTQTERENTGKRAGLILRAVAFIIDIFLAFTLITFLYVPDRESKGILFPLALAALLLFEISFRDTPGKKLLRLKTIYEKESFKYLLLRHILKYTLGSLLALFAIFNRKRLYLHDKLCHTTVKKIPCRFRALRAILLFILSLNIFITFGWGNVIWGWVNQEIIIDSRRVNTLPQKITMESLKIPGEYAVIWNNDMRFQMPSIFKGMTLENCGGFNGYGIIPTADMGKCGIFVGEVQFTHPCTQCEIPEDSPLRVYRPCHLTPVEFQDYVFNATMKSRFFIWNPLNMYEVNSRLIEKFSHVLGIGDDFFIRKLDKKDISIIWIYRERLPRPTARGKIRFFMDTIYLATPSSYNVLLVIWKKMSRDEKLVWQLLQSLELHTPSSRDIDEEIKLAKEHQNIVHAVNAFRMSKKKYKIGELLFNMLRQKGTPAEKNSFRISIGDLGKKDRRYLKLIFLTQDWTD